MLIVKHEVTYDVIYEVIMMKSTKPSWRGAKAQNLV